jgi:hypothetical protein
MEFTDFDTRLADGDAGSPLAFVAVAPVGTGDWWGFRVQDGVCAEAVDFWFHDDDVFEPAGSDFLEFLVQQGLKR